MQIFAARELLVAGAHTEALDDLDRYHASQPSVGVSKDALLSAATHLEVAYDRGGCPEARE